MAADEQRCYVYVQLPGTVETVPCASLKVRSIGAGAYEGTFTYGRRYLERPAVVALDPYHLPLSTSSDPLLEICLSPVKCKPAHMRDWIAHIERHLAGVKFQSPVLEHLEEIQNC